MFELPLAAGLLFLLSHRGQQVLHLLGADRAVSFRTHLLPHIDLLDILESACRVLICLPRIFCLQASLDFHEV